MNSEQKTLVAYVPSRKLLLAFLLPLVWGAKTPDRGGLNGHKPIPVIKAEADGLIVLPGFQRPASEEAVINVKGRNDDVFCGDPFRKGRKLPDELNRWLWLEDHDSAQRKSKVSAVPATGAFEFGDWVRGMADTLLLN